MDTKQLIIVRKDLNMPIGKFSAQVAHASLLSYLESVKINEALANTWIEGSYTKVVLQVKNENQLMKQLKICEDNNLPHTLIKDEGRTVFNEPTYTCLGVGPCRSEDLDGLFKRLQVYRD